MKNFLKLFIAIVFILLHLQMQAQDFFRNEFDKNKMYLLLANPTATNVETVHFLTKKKLLNIDSGKVHFVGVYHRSQHYDFEKALLYIHTHGLSNFHLHEVREPLIDSNLFRHNALSEELKHIFDHSIGIFFFGGPDIPPSVYGEANTLSVVTDPERHYFESTFLFHLLGGSQNDEFPPFLAEHPDYLVTGFCLGLQTMNVATGGTLIQDIPSEVYQTATPEEIVHAGKETMHRNYWHLISDDELLTRINFHTIRFTDHPFFGEKVKIKKNSTPLVYSSHHQAVKKQGKGLEITAFSSDGKIIEGLAHSRYRNVFAVQFHPEVPALYEDREESKIAPSDKPETYHSMLGRKNRKFHKKYLKHISKSIKEAYR